MRQLEIIAVRVLDTTGKRLYQDDQLNTEAVIAKLDQYKDVLQAYGRVEIICATKSQLAQNWKDAYRYYVHYSNASTVQQPNPWQMPGTVPQGFISQAQAELMAANKALEMRLSFKDEIQGLKDMIEKKNSNDPMNYLPLAGLFMDISPEKMKQMMMLKMMESGNASALAGIYNNTPAQGQTTKLTVEGTDQEKIKKIQDNMDKISEAQNVTLDKLVILTDALKENPVFVDVALMQMQQAQKKPMAGPEKEPAGKKKSSSKKRK